MVIGSFASYTKTKSVESAVWCLLTLDDDDVEQVTQVLVVLQVIFFTAYGIKIPEQGSGSELFFFFSNNNQNKTQMKIKQIIEHRIITDE